MPNDRRTFWLSRDTKSKPAIELIWTMNVLEALQSGALVIHSELSIAAFVVHRR